MAFNLGGALADISWLEAGDVPIVSFHCYKDEYAPIDTGDVIVPTTGDFVVEVMGSRTVAHYSNAYGNNDVFVNADFTDNFTNEDIDLFIDSYQKNLLDDVVLNSKIPIWVEYLKTKKASYDALIEGFLPVGLFFTTFL